MDRQLKRTTLPCQLGGEHIRDEVEALIFQKWPRMPRAKQGLCAAGVSSPGSEKMGCCGEDGRTGTFGVVAISILILAFATVPARAMDCPWGGPWNSETAATCRPDYLGQSICPNGYYPANDQQNRRVCRSMSGDQDYYGPGQACPMGTQAWRDQWGNPTCRRL